jgi:hypothetical protein
MLAAGELERRRLNGAGQVRDASGRWRTVSTWNPAAADGRGARAFTRFGLHLGHRRLRYIVEVPVTAHFKRSDGRVDTYTHQPDGTRWTIPVDEDAIGDVPIPDDLRIVRDVGDHQKQKRFIREAIVHYLRQQPRDGNGDIVLQMFEQSDCWFSLLPRGGPEPAAPPLRAPARGDALQIGSDPGGHAGPSAASV